MLTLLFGVEMYISANAVTKQIDLLGRLGEKIDLVSCPYQNTYWGDRYNAFHLWDLPLCITCAKEPATRGLAVHYGGGPA